MREYLGVRYGHQWWRSRKAGDELRDIWNAGSRYDVEELARLMGFDMNVELMIRELTTAMSGA